MILLDTTILVYAVGGEHPLRDACADLVRRVGDGEVVASTTVEVIQEFVHVRARRRGAADAARLGRAYVDLLAPLFAPDADDLRRGLDLSELHDGLGAFDAVLGAVALARDEIVSLASADSAFAAVDGLRWIDPATDDWLG